MLDILKVCVRDLKPGDFMLPALRIIDRIEEASKRSCHVYYRNGTAETRLLREHVRIYRETDE